jgi:hypothetical protein
MSDAFSGEIVALAVERNLESELNQGDIHLINSEVW